MAIGKMRVAIIFLGSVSLAAASSVSLLARDPDEEYPLPNCTSPDECGLHPISGDALFCKLQSFNTSSFQVQGKCDFCSNCRKNSDSVSHACYPVCQNGPSTCEDHYDCATSKWEPQFCRVARTEKGDTLPSCNPCAQCVRDNLALDGKCPEICKGMPIVCETQADCRGGYFCHKKLIPTPTPKPIPSPAPGSAPESTPEASPSPSPLYTPKFEKTCTPCFLLGSVQDAVGHDDVEQGYFLRDLIHQCPIGPVNCKQDSDCMDGRVCRPDKYPSRSSMSTCRHTKGHPVVKEDFEGQDVAATPTATPAPALSPTPTASSPSPSPSGSPAPPGVWQRRAKYGMQLVHEAAEHGSSGDVEEMIAAHSHSQKERDAKADMQSLQERFPIIKETMAQMQREKDEAVEKANNNAKKETQRALEHAWQKIKDEPEEENNEI